MVEAGTKIRKGVVLETCSNERLLVAWMTGTEKGSPCVCVKRAARYGKALRLSKDSWFHGANIEPLDTATITQVFEQECPPGLYTDLLTMLEDQAKLDSGN
jgi:hypothetical protein